MLLFWENTEMDLSQACIQLMKSILMSRPLTDAV